MQYNDISTAAEEDAPSSDEYNCETDANRFATCS